MRHGGLREPSPDGASTSSRGRRHTASTQPGAAPSSGPQVIGVGEQRALLRAEDWFVARGDGRGDDQ